MIWKNRSSLAPLVVGVTLCLLRPNTGAAVPPNEFDRFLDFKEISPRMPPSLAPDGQSVAFTYALSGEPYPTAHDYSPTGVTIAEGGVRMRAVLLDTASGRAVELSKGTDASWSPVWSPRGTLVAYYSDQGGKAGLWLWSKQTGVSLRFPNVIARPFIGIEAPVWSPDGRFILCKTLAAGAVLGEVSDPALDHTVPKFAPHDRAQPGVNVLTTLNETRAQPAGDPVASEVFSRSRADLAILDVISRTARKIAAGVSILYYAWSPDGTQVAYVERRADFGAEGATVDIKMFDVANGGTRTIIGNINMNYANTWSWSPDGRFIAYTNPNTWDNGSAPVAGTKRVLRKGTLHLYSLVEDAEVKLFSDASPTFDATRQAPVWSPDSRSILSVSDAGELWGFDVSGPGRAITRASAYNVATIAQKPFAIGEAADSGARVWLVVRAKGNAPRSVVRVNLATGEADSKVIIPGVNAVNVIADDQAGELLAAVQDHAHPAEFYGLNPRAATARRISDLNPDLTSTSMGSARLLSWTAADGSPRSGTLILPPTYKEGQKLPLVLLIYGGSLGSNSLQEFGGFGSAALYNMQVLALQGYAVLYPDIPVRTGHAMLDIYTNTTAAADAAVAQGYADPDRLAVMGQSYGAYSVLSTIVQTTRFKAAVMTGAIEDPDVVTTLLSITPAGDEYLAGFGWFEQGQGNMGVSLWADPQVYIRNSPIYGFDKITTPLLIGGGADDHSLTGALDTFSALRHLGKRVEYRLYEGERHVIQGRANVADFLERRSDFLAQYLDVARGSTGAIIMDGNHARPATGT